MSADPLTRDLERMAADFNIPPELAGFYIEAAEDLVLLGPDVYGDQLHAELEAARATALALPDDVVTRLTIRKNVLLDAMGITAVLVLPMPPAGKTH